MFEAPLSELVQVLDGKLQGQPASVQGVSIDSRSIHAGQLFVALRGERFDGHQFVRQAATAGAAAALVERYCDVDLPQIKVPDCKQALGCLAHHWRQRCGTALIAVTGSNGKTTVKEMIAAVLSTDSDTHKTQGNLNNDIGVPLSLLGMAPSHRFGVFELGANHSGEIDYLAGLVQPQVAVITNAAQAHLEGFGSLSAVVQAKGELLDHLADDGIAILNADDAAFLRWRERVPANRCISFGLTPAADVHLRQESDKNILCYQTACYPLQLPLLGLHNLRNALASCAVAIALQVPLEQALTALSQLRPVAGRNQHLVGFAGARIIDDSYNANPASFRAAIDVLASCHGHKVLVMGDMAELGPASEALHHEIGVLAQRGGIDALFGVGKYTAAAVTAFGPEAYLFSQHQELIDALHERLGSNTTVLVKGSRSAHMEQIVAQLVAENDARMHLDTSL